MGELRLALNRNKLSMVIGWMLSWVQMEMFIAGKRI